MQYIERIHPSLIDCFWFEKDISLTDKKEKEEEKGKTIMSKYFFKKQTDLMKKKKILSNKSYLAFKWCSIKKIRFLDDNPCFFLTIMIVICNLFYIDNIFIKFLIE